MQRASNFVLLPLNPEIKRALRKIRKDKRNTALAMVAEDNNQNN